MRRLFVPIRIKIMMSLLLVVTAVVSVITFTMANLFHHDKKVYIHDLSSIVALNTAQECHALLVGYSERLQAYARIISRKELPQTEKAVLLKGLFQDFPELVGVFLYRNGEEIASVVDAPSLESGGLTQEDIRELYRKSPLPFNRIEGGQPFVKNSTLNDKLPMLTIAVPLALAGHERPLTVAAVVRLDGFLALTSRSGVFDVFVADTSGALLAHRDRMRVVRQEVLVIPPEVGAIDPQRSASISLEYKDSGTPMIGGFAPVNFGGLVTAAQIPSSAAYLASRDLLNRLLAVALILLLVSALAGLFWSRRITRPVERLSGATRTIAQGRFDIKVNVDSRDEIGTLAASFNQMAAQLSDREKALRDAQVKLTQSEKLAALGQLGAGIAHEVKNPLAGILGCAQLSLRGAEDGTPLKKNLLLIEKETKRCKTIIENLLKFARRETSVLEPTDINRVVEDAVAIALHQLELQQIKTRMDLDRALPVVLASANQIQQVLMNLMLNAQHAMEGRPGSISLTTRQRDPEWIEIRVSDTGPGISAENMKKLFEPFFTTKPVGKGTGLGLSVSYGIIKAHGGEIRAESEPGKGATFIITLPLPRDETTSPALNARTA
jgi:signal transduction histidine kinase